MTNLKQSQEADIKPGPYYVSAIDAGRVYLMAGPYATHSQAINMVDAACNLASDIDGRAWFMDWGTIRIEGSKEVGRLTKRNLI